MTEVNRGESVPVMADTWTPGETIVGHQVIDLVKMKGRPFSDGWEQWKPNPSWGIPVL